VRTFYIDEHQHKGHPYKQALLSAGYRFTKDDPDVALVDRDWCAAGARMNSVIMVYPHTAITPWWYDGIHKIGSQVRCVFVVGRGQQAALEEFAPHAYSEVTGWPWCEQKPFAKVDNPINVLFGSIHPPARFPLSKAKLEANTDIHNELDLLVKAGKRKATVRHIKSLGKNGIICSKHINYIQGGYDGSTKEIDRADVVIGEGMFMYLAVARGKPTIGVNQHISQQCSENEIPLNWERYGPSMAYPINYEKGRLDELIQLAASGEQTAWRERFIGESMDPKRFVETVERVWRESKGVG
jgi:hypothetical protein